MVSFGREWDDAYSRDGALGSRGRYHGDRRPSSDDNFHRPTTIVTRQTEYHEALPSSANVQSHLTSSFDDDGNAS